MKRVCRDCFFWSPLHHDKILDESVCGLTTKTVTTGGHTCGKWKKDFLEHMK